MSFFPYSGTYDDLVEQVHLKVRDLFILLTLNSIVSYITNTFLYLTYKIVSMLRNLMQW